MGPGPDAGATVRVMVGIPTYRRPEQLRALLERLEHMDGLGEVPVTVADNDPGRSAAGVVAGFRDVLTLDYVAVSGTGVVHGRNALLAAADGFDHLLFLDDDQEPEPGWYRAMLKGIQAWPEAVVSGAVEHYTHSQVQDPYVASWVARRDVLPLGTEVVTAPTGNSALPLAKVRALRHPWFDERFSRIGGEDADLFRRLELELGVPVVAWHDAKVREAVDPQRCTRAWIRRRLVREGLARATMEPGGAARVLSLGALRAASGALMWTTARATRTRPSYVHEARLLRGVGYLMKPFDAASSRRFQEYGGD